MLHDLPNIALRRFKCLSILQISNLTG